MDTRAKIATYYVENVGKLATLATSFYVKDLTGNTRFFAVFGGMKE